MVKEPDDKEAHGVEEVNEPYWNSHMKFEKKYNKNF